MIGFSWRQLGAFVNEGGNLGDKLDAFAGAGGRYITPVLFQLDRDDDHACAWNREHIDYIKQQAANRGIRCGGWFNCWGGDAAADAKTIADYALTHQLAPIVLDCEFAYQGNTKLAELTQALRERIPVGTWPIGVSTNSLNDSQVYNGRRGPVRGDADRSFRRLNIAVLPQWYSSPRYVGPWSNPVENTKWLIANGMLDNFRDPTYENNRAVALAGVHASVEVTGLEDADLRTSLDLVASAQARGIGLGLLLYLLENTPASDFPLLAAVRGQLFT